MTPAPESHPAGKDDAPSPPSPKPVPLPVLILFLLLSLLGLLALVGGVVEARARTAETTGQVQDSGETVVDGNAMCKGATVTFPVDEPLHTYTGTTPDRCPQDGGATTTTIYYDPDDPANAETSTGSVALTGFMLLAALAVLLCVVSLLARALGAARRRWSRLTPT